MKIFLADDSTTDARFFRMALAEVKPDATLQHFTDGVTLMKNLVNGAAPDIVFLDINMPCKNGFECLSEIREDKKLSSLPVVIFTTSDNEQDIKTMHEEGADLYLSKPFNLDDWGVLIGKAIDILAQHPARPAFENFVIRKY